jgi:hypothetical protein
MQAPPNPVLILLNNISLSQESANISWPLQLAPVPGSIVSAVSQAGASWPGAPGNSPLVGCLFDLTQRAWWLICMEPACMLCGLVRMDQQLA